MKAVLAAWWDERNAREKRLLSIGGLVIVLVIFYSTLISPALDGREVIRETLPGLKRQLATMQGQAAEAKRLAGSAQNAAPSGDSLNSAVTSSLADRGLNATKVQLSGNAVQIEMKNVSFSAWIVWLDDMRKQLKVHVTQAHVEPTGANGRVDLRATIEATTAANERPAS
jgi:general secretion pathway protein M